MIAIEQQVIRAPTQTIGHVITQANSQQAGELELCFHHAKPNEFYQLITHLLYNHYEQDRTICNRQRPDPIYRRVNGY